MGFSSQVTSDAPGRQPEPGPAPTKYWAFLSYSHQDEAWAAWLHRELETYKVPRRLVGRPHPDGRIPERLFPIFRDRDELSGSSSLSASIQEALAQSRFLIVLCSPHAAASHWVHEEIRLFKSLKGENRVFCLIVDGEPAMTDDSECFPPALRFRVQPDGTLGNEPAEPLAADVRPKRDGKANAKLRLVAGLLGIGFDELKQRDRKRRFRQRLQTSVAALAAAGILGLAYLGLIDVSPDLPLPGHKAISEFLDLHELSRFRKIHTLEQIQKKAPDLRRQLVARLLGKLSPEGHLIKNTSGQHDIWTAGQSFSGIAKAPEASAGQLEELGRGFDTTFDSGQQVYEADRPIGWSNRPEDDYAEAPSTLWTAIALAVILQRQDQLASETAREHWQRLEYTQKILANFQDPREAGGWNLFANQGKDEPSDSYSSVLALQALLETRKAGLPWEGSTRRRDELIVSTARRLTDRFTEFGELGGWHVLPRAYGPPVDGLTLQIYSALLGAEEVPGFVIPARIRRCIPKHLALLFERDVDYAYQTGEIYIAFVQSGKLRQEEEAIKFLWYPWGIKAAWLWLERNRESVDSDVDTVRVRRALGHLVIDLGNQAFKSTEEDEAFRSAEMLYALGEIPPP